MKPSIHYTFAVRLIRRIEENGEIDFIEISKEFIDDEPINARKAAFKYYQNYIDVLLQSKGYEYKSDKIAREVIKLFCDPNASIEIDPGSNMLVAKNYSTNDISLGNGIGIFVFNEEHQLDMIHGIGDLWRGSSSPESLLRALTREISWYNQYKYSMGDYETTLVFCNKDEWLKGNRDNEPQIYNILRTPFDWTGMDKPYWWGEPEEEPSIDNRTFEELIAGGESNQIEFKPSLLYNFKTKAAGIGVKGIIAKTICAFLNSNGGYLFIGVNDKGEANGLSYDFSLAGGKNPKDYFRLEFDDTLKQFLPLSIIEKISGEFIEVNGKDIFVVIVYPSKSKPIFLNGQQGKEFWVRWTASTRPFTDIEEITNYCLEHWCKNE